MDYIKKIIKKIIQKSPFNDLFKKAQNAKYIYTVRKQLKADAALNKITKPQVINFNANDICNSKCVMCNIWQQKIESQLSPAELKLILSDPLYQEVKSIGITGGEPTLRDDLVELYKVCIDTLPSLAGLSIITNAIKKDDVIERINEVVDLCALHGKHFSMMVSLDGYADAHDHIRGRKGNFESAIEVIENFKQKGVQVETGTTISKDNVWDAEELLHFLKKKKWHGRFRIAEFINRLYNNDKVAIIRNFSDDEIYQLTLFFYKLIFTFETNETYQRTYYSIIGMLNGEKRLIGCPYQSTAINLNAKGEMAYCAPKSPVVGTALTTSSSTLYFDNLDIREGIINTSCDTCIHDYHAAITLKEFDLNQERQRWKEHISLSNKKTIPSVIKINKGTSVHVFIVGWYGTETVGDKAILAGIIEDLKRTVSIHLKITVGSLFPYITLRTLKELNIEGDVIDVYSKDFAHFSANSDIVIMGGGPLMDLDELAIPLHAFRIAKKHKHRTVVYGCGIGPLHYERNERAVKEIITLSSDVFLRDQASVDKALSYGAVQATLTGDYARHYLLGKYQLTPIRKSGLISCYLREWTMEYSSDKDVDAFSIQKKKFELGLVAFIKEQVKLHSATEIRLQNMHNFVVGNDDRDFSRYFIETYFSDYTDCLITYDTKLSTVDSIVDQMQQSELNICMRFHSVLFAHTLQTKYVAIDYTLGGKIHNYLTDNNQKEQLITIQNLIQ